MEKTETFKNIAPLLLALASGTVSAGYGCMLENALPQTYVYPNENGENVWSHGHSERFRYGNDEFARCRKLLPPLPEVERGMFEQYRPDLLAGNYDDQQDPLSQDVRSCFVAGDYVYVGLEVYHGEFVRELGGLGRFDLKNKEWEIRRGHGFVENSITDLSVDGENVWLLLEYETEGTTRPAAGFLHYNWATDTVTVFPQASQKPEPAPCQLRFNGLGRVGSELWVGGDLGLSKLDLRTGTWSHHISREVGEPMNAISCGDLLKELFSSLPAEQSPDDGACDLDGVSAREQFFSMLFEYRQSLFNLLPEAMRIALFMKSTYGPLYEYRMQRGWLTDAEKAEREQRRLEQKKVFSLPELAEPGPELERGPEAQ